MRFPLAEIASLLGFAYFQNDVTLRAYAKINFGLRILRKREDGFHDIETILHRINLFDEVTLESADRTSLDSAPIKLATDDNNLCIRAAKLLKQQRKVTSDVKISLKKNIPIGGGLGGGSSDAATTLLGLVKLWKLAVDEITLHSMASQLGSDVPYFLKRGTAHATGLGDVLDYFNLDLPYWLVTVYPRLSVSTAWAYQHAQIPTSKPSIALKQLLIEHIEEPRMLMNLIRNDFEPLVLRTYEPVARVKQAMYIAGADFAQMSGSGSSVFGLFTNEHYAKDAAGELSKHYDVFVTEPNFQPYEM